MMRFLNAMQDRFGTSPEPKRPMTLPHPVRFSDGTWIFDEDVRRVCELFFALARDHVDQRFADYTYGHFLASIDAYSREHPSVVCPTLYNDRELQHPRIVRPVEGLAATDEEAVRQEILRNHSQVTCEILPRWLEAAGVTLAGAPASAPSQEVAP